MARRPHVPAELSSAPFRGTLAVRNGLLTRQQLRSSAWVRLMRDVYAPRELALDAATRVRALALVTDPTMIVCGLTAAWLQGAWQPPPGRPLPLEVTRPVRAPGTLVGGYSRRRLTLRGTPDRDQPLTGVSELDHDVVEMDGVATTSATRTCFDLVRQYGLVEAVAVVDAFAFRGLLRLPLFDAYCWDRRRWPWVRQARTVVELASDAARSPGESRLRMVVVLAGLGDPLVNTPVYRGSVHVATPDLTLLGRRPLALEYDGAYHDHGDQPAADRRRQTRFVTATEIPMVRYGADELLHRRHEIVEAVVRKTGRRPLQELEAHDFVRGRLRWLT